MVNPHEIEPKEDASIDDWHAYGRAQRRRADKLFGENKSARSQLIQLRKEITRKNLVHRHYKQTIATLNNELDELQARLRECQPETFRSLLKALWDRVRVGGRPCRTPGS